MGFGRVNKHATWRGRKDNRVRASARQVGQFAAIDLADSLAKLQITVHKLSIQESRRKAITEPPVSLTVEVEATMTSDDLNREQLKAIQVKISSTLKYLDKQLSRMQQRYFSNDDPHWQAANDSRLELLKLVTALRCKSAMKRDAAKRAAAKTNNRSGYRLERPRQESQ